MHKTKIRIAGGTFVALAVLAAGAMAASAGPGGTPPNPEEHISADRNSAVDEIANKLSSHTGSTGYAQVALDYEKRVVTVLWKGDPPKSVTDLAGVSSDGVEVVVRKSRFSEQEVLDAGVAIVEADIGEKGEASVAAVAPNQDYSGVIVEVVDGSKAARSMRDSATKYSEMTGIPASIKVAPGSPVPLTRQNDSAPWQGGGLLQVPGGHCSSGFAVLKQNGEGRLISAAHCASVGNTIRDGAGDLIGTVSSRDASLDALLIDPAASPGTIGKVFGGPRNASPSHSRYQFFVGGSANPTKDSTVCTSGANSGEHCSRTVLGTSETFPCVGGICQGFRVGGSGLTAVGGDSGGPIYAMRSDGKVGARGIISSGVPGTQTACGSVTAPTTKCFSQIWGINIVRILNRWDLEIEK